jgi:hypothetical protein
MHRLQRPRALVQQGVPARQLEGGAQGGLQGAAGRRRVLMCSPRWLPLPCFALWPGLLPIGYRFGVHRSVRNPVWNTKHGSHRTQPGHGNSKPPSHRFMGSDASCEAERPRGLFERVCVHVRAWCAVLVCCAFKAWTLGEALCVRPLRAYDNAGGSRLPHDSLCGWPAAMRVDQSLSARGERYATPCLGALAGRAGRQGAPERAPW